MPTIRNKFYPYHDIDQHNVLSLYSTLTTGTAGTLVKIATGTANPQNADGWSNNSVGASIAGTVSFRYETKMKVMPTASGDTKYNALGLMLYSTQELDENGIPLKYNDKRAKEIGAVISGETNPIVTKGVFGMWGGLIDQSTSAVQPGNLVVVSRSGNGILASVDPTDATKFNTGSSSFIYTPAHVVGKWLTSLPTSSNTGIASEFATQGGYALFTFDTSV